MDSPEAANQWPEPTPSLAELTDTVTALPVSSSTVLALGWAFAASTLHRVRRGEGALLAINLSLVAYHGLGLASALVSVLTIALMYAFNDLYDAPIDSNNPKKDRALIAVYLDHRRLAGLSILVLKLLTVGFALVTLGPRATVAAAGAMLANVIYSTLFKGAPVIDVAWCGLWGALYAAIVTASMPLLVLVGLMTAVCHLYQALDDRASDTANDITTTAVRSAALSRDVLVVLSVLLLVALRAPLGTAWAATAFIPLVFFASTSARTGWLLTKAYFAIVWLSVLGLGRAGS